MVARRSARSPTSLASRSTGTRDLCTARHYDPSGFAHERRYLLVSANELRRDESTRGRHGGQSRTKVSTSTRCRRPRPAGDVRAGRLRIASRADASALLRLVRRRAGASMPGPPCGAVLRGRASASSRALSPCAGPPRRRDLRVLPDGADRPGSCIPSTIDRADHLVDDCRSPTTTSRELIRRDRTSAQRRPESRNYRLTTRGFSTPIMFEELSYVGSLHRRRRRVRTERPSPPDRIGPLDALPARSSTPSGLRSLGCDRPGPCRGGR